MVSAAGRARLSAFEKQVLCECERVAGDVLAGHTFAWARPFEMARWIRGHPDSASAKPIRVAEFAHRNSAAVREAYPDEEGFVTELMAVWNKVRVIGGHDLLGSAAASELAELLPTAPEVSRPGNC